MIEKCLANDLKDFEKWLLFRKISSNTLKAYFSDFNEIFKFFYDGTLIKLDEFEKYSLNDWRSYLSFMQDQKKSSKTQERTIAALRSYAKFKKDNNIDLSINKLKNLKKKDSNFNINVEYEDIEKFLNFYLIAENFIQKRNKSLVFLLYSTGLRINEALNLKWSDLFEKYIKILGKGNKIRTVPLFDFIKDMLLDYKKTQILQNELIFINNLNKKLNATSVARDFRNVCAKLGLYNITPHTLRHACATHLLKAGCNLRSIQSLLGHANLEITKNYINYSNEDLKKSFFSKID